MSIIRLPYGVAFSASYSLRNAPTAGSLTSSVVSVIVMLYAAENSISSRFIVTLPLLTGNTPSITVSGAYTAP